MLDSFSSLKRTIEPHQNINYFGSANSKLIEKDFSREERRGFRIRKEILYESELATDKEVNRKEVEYIKHYNSNNSLIVGGTNPDMNITIS